MNAERRLLAGSIAASAALHSLLFAPWTVPHGHAEPVEVVELDLAGPGGPSGRPAAAPKAPAQTAAEWSLPVPGAAPSATAPQAPHTPPEEHPAGPSVEGGASGSGGGTGSGTGTDKPPVLLNHGELQRVLRRLYPESERALGREGMVVLYLTVGADGRVTQSEVERGAGAAFNAAALSAAKSLLYAPAEKDGRPVPVNLHQAVLFKMER